MALTIHSEAPGWKLSILEMARDPNRHIDLSDLVLADEIPSQLVKTALVVAKKLNAQEKDKMDSLTIHSVLPGYTFSILEMARNKYMAVTLSVLVQEGKIPRSLAKTARLTANNVTSNQKETKTMKDKIQENLITDSTNAAQLQAGRILYTTTVKLLAPVLPKFAWYKKLFMSSSKREAAVLLAVLGMLHLVRGKYDHYAFEAITLYINYELQSHMVDLGGAELQKLLKLPTKVE